MRMTMGAGLALLLSACGGANVTTTANGGVTVETGGETVSVNTKDCKRGGHIPLYADAKITTCVASTDADKRGTIIYTSAATPSVVLGWYKAEAEKAGLKVNLQTDMNLSASQGARTMMVMAMTQGGATQVTVNWGE